MDNKRKTGSIYEHAVGVYLEQHGYEVITYNYRCKCGEIDVIAKENGYLVFCEVKYRKTLYKGHPFEAVGLRKQQVISRCALHYVTVHHLEYLPCRFDVIGVLGSQIQIVKNAFEYQG